MTNLKFFIRKIIAPKNLFTVIAILIFTAWVSKWEYEGNLRAEKNKVIKEKTRYKNLKGQINDFTKEHKRAKRYFEQGGYK